MIASFNPVSLGDWLLVCRELRVPHVPGEQIATYDREQLLASADLGPNPPEFEAVCQRIVAAFEDGFMFRFDCCAPAEVKVSLAEGRPHWNPNMVRQGPLSLWPKEHDGRVIELPEHFECTCLDYRSFEIVWSYPRPTVPVWKRPWVDIEVRDRYPVEFRAFVVDGKLEGVSSYYPQRALDPDDPIIRPSCETIGLYVFQFARFLHDFPFEWPRDAPDGIPDNSFTADFVVRRESGRVEFLEGGPPHHPSWGAHPCCFPPGGIAGIALEPQPGAPTG